MECEHGIGSLRAKRLDDANAESILDLQWTHQGLVEMKIDVMTTNDPNLFFDLLLQLVRTLTSK